MKTKTFIENLKTLGYKHNIVQRNKGEKHHKLLIFDNRECGNNHPVGWIFINRNNSMRLLEGDERLFDLMYEYARTPLEEREEEKKYRYEFPIHITAKNVETKHICRNHTFRESGESDQLIIDLSSMDCVVEDESFHFTNKEVEKFTGKDRALFNACEKIEVTSND